MMKRGRILAIVLFTVVAVLAIAVGVVVVCVRMVPYTDMPIDDFEGKVISSNPLRSPEELERIMREVDKRVDEFAEKHPDRGRRGFVHTEWDYKKQILLNEYGIVWKSSDDLGLTWSD